MKLLTIISIATGLGMASVAGATQRNIAPEAVATASDWLPSCEVSKVNDGLARYDGRGEWACVGAVTSWGEMHLPWVQLDWKDTVSIDRVVLYDRVTMDEHTAGGTLVFSDGSEISITQIPNDGAPKSISFPSKRVKWVRFEATDGCGKNIGLSEMEVFETENSGTRYVEWVDPYIETTRGRWFFCTPGGLPMGMVAAHAFTRNKNQGGGGYNYNFNEILGFSQINDWMISGPNIMPVTGNVNPLMGIEGWKSKFSHDCEIIQPGYHKLFLDRYRTWVEYTATDRVVFYNISYTEQGANAGLVVDAGSILGNCSMNDAVLYRLDEHTVAGKFMTTDRFWGGPDSVGLYFVLKSDRPFCSVDSWSEKGILPDTDMIAGDDAGMLLRFDLDDSRQVRVKVALSYTSIENAAENLEKELSGWDFYSVRDNAQAVWDEMLGRIDVQGGTTAQKVKFYTDLWHVFLGRHKINDVNGSYPDYAWGKYSDHRTADTMKVRQLPVNAEGIPVHNMYGFDGLWLTQWNINILWGLVCPEVLDDFTANLVQYADNGGLLPRGGCAGGYSFIMTGCPSTSMIVSAYMRGLLRKTDPEHAFEVMKRNHLPGGMMSYENPDDLKFYIRHGYCPENAGKTLQWAFEDWGLARMAARLGKKADAREFDRRSHGWTSIFNHDQKMIFPKDRNGNWTNLDPLDKTGWVECNSWQSTWYTPHDFPRLMNLMGGSDVFCEKLDYAFRQAEEYDFVYAYGGGYISYANQPGCSNAHLFSYGGQPWLTQYWVRKVKEQAYGGITPDKGYGGHDEDQGQMGGVSALMAMGLFSVTGAESDIPYYDITSPIFDTITIRLNRDYYSGDEFVIKTYGNSDENCYIQKAAVNGKDWDWSQIDHQSVAEGGILELWLGNTPEKGWGKQKYNVNQMSINK